MYIKNIVIQNFGSIENLKILEKDLFQTENNPKPILLVGKNGSGKTMLLSSIADSFFELANKAFEGVLPKEGLGYSYYKMAGGINQRLGSEYGLCFFQFSEGDKKYEYLEKIGKINFASCKEKTDGLLTIGSEMVEDQGCKSVSNTDKDFQNDFNFNTYCFFPSDRFEYPSWVNRETILNNPQFSDNIKYNNRLDKLILIRKALDDIKNWILDIVLDSRADLVITEQGVQALNLNNVLFLQKSKKNVEEILSSILEKDVEFEINVRGQGLSRLKIIDKVTKKDLVQRLDSLSSGQSTLLSIFSSIIKLSDQFNPGKSINIQEIKGIVLIDEIDLHLHIKLQKDVLPNLISMFPKIQFIVSSHSPFFLSGMSKKFGDNILLVNMPSGNYLEKVDKFNEFEEAFAIFEGITNDHKKELDAIKEKLATDESPLVITEGKTDWKHIKKALEKLQNKGLHSRLKIKFLEYEDNLEMGDITLKKMCQELSKIPQHQKTIAIFDRDNDEIVKLHDGLNFIDWGNNVYSFCIPRPVNRQDYKKISIEFYYTDEEIKTACDGKRLYFNNELKKVVETSLTSKSVVKNIISILEQPDLIEESDKKIFDQDVNLIQDRNGNSVAHSKSIFAENVLNEKPGFAGFGVNNFSLIFDLLEQIVS